MACIFGVCVFVDICTSHTVSQYTHRASKNSSNFLIYWLHFIQWLSVVLIIVNIVFIVCCVVSSQKIDKLLGEFTKEDEDAIAEELECIQV